MRPALRSISLALLGVASVTAQARTKYDINTRPLPDNTVLRGVRILDGTGAPPMDDMAIVIHRKKIVAIGPNAQVKTPSHAEVLDWRGKTVIPGLIDDHAHLGLVLHEKGESSADAYTEANVVGELYRFQRYGVTTIASLGANRDLVYDLRKRQKQGLIGGATLLTAGRGIAIEGGAPPLATQPDAVDRVSTEAQAREDVRIMAKQKVDLIKIWVDSLRSTKPAMSPAIYRAVIDEAHKHHLRVAAHVYYLADAKELVDSGVDILAHSVRNTSVDQALIDAMKAHGTWYIATLAADESSFTYVDHPDLLQSTFISAAAGPELTARLQDPAYRAKVEADPATAIKRQDLKIAEENLHRMVEAGVNVGFGTDAGAFPVRIPGVMEHRELQLMVQAGLTPMQALVLATGKAAALLQLRDTGTITTGKNADLIVVDGDPLADITNTTHITAVFHQGRLNGDITPR